jgi:hypothetical protein
MLVASDNENLAILIRLGHEKTAASFNLIAACHCKYRGNS